MCNAITIFSNMFTLVFWCPNFIGIEEPYVNYWKENTPDLRITLY